ncbi:cupin domain-containing protein [Spirosoma foliorum]|uniref:Cupin domain-containing protein n=1 Tax=Spirosoma foliorum TaxID=2710596 RepID=A0A7G5GPE6_9BACT|nr:cupin domain-containing protein [Spirosoma foliorum]QMW00738.1 cupin domain-containing protein [Spirosoma foliorum]
MKTLLIISAILASSLSGQLFAQHDHTAATNSPTNVTRSIIRQQLLNEKGIDNREVQMLIVDYPPNSSSPAHRHPCPTFGYLLEGELESTFEGKTRVYKKGDTFYEFSNGLHSSARNTSSTVPAKLLVFFVAEPGKPTSVLEK